MKNPLKMFVFVLTVCGVFSAAEDEVKTEAVSVMEGYSITLNPDLNQTQGINLIQWRFGDDGSAIAQMHGNEISYPHDERFRDRVELDNQTGSLSIRNLRTEHFGFYTVKISSKQTSYKIFRVTVSDAGLSPVAVAAICIVVMLVFMALIVFCYRMKIADIKKETHEKVFVNACSGDDVTLHTGIDLEPEHQILWTFEALGARIAELREGVRETFGADEAFRDTLTLDETGSLTIRKIKMDHIGVYILQIRSTYYRWWSYYKRFHVNANDRITIPVMEGDDLTLETEIELTKDEQVKWLFGDPMMRALIAEINGETGEIHTYDNRADGRFRNRLKVDHLTGALTIMNASPEHCGLYERQIMSSKCTIFTLRMVSVRARMISVEDGKNVTLEIDAVVQKDDQILWMFGVEETLIAQMKGGTRETHDVADGRFRDRLKLEDSGSLSISNVTTEHFGAYKAQIISRGKTSYKKFNVVMLAEYVPVKKGESVTLHTGTIIKENDQILWMFGEKKTLIAKFKEDTKETTTNDEVFNGRFRGRLELDEQTGSLTIRTFTTEHTGFYTLKINRGKGSSINKCFDVFGRVRMMSGEEEMKGNRVNESSTLVMPMLNEEALDGVNEKEGAGSL